jgi:hypothetical protein
MIKAPWTAEQVENLRKRQAEPTMHSYTCGDCGNDMYPTEHGWECYTDGCNSTQDWAHTSDVTGEFHGLADFRHRLNDEIDALVEGL